MGIFLSWLWLRLRDRIGLRLLLYRLWPIVPVVVYSLQAWRAGESCSIHTLNSLSELTRHNGGFSHGS